MGIDEERLAHDKTTRKDGVLGIMRLPLLSFFHLRVLRASVPSVFFAGMPNA